jgi:hypothetical protein
MMTAPYANRMLRFLIGIMLVVKTATAQGQCPAPSVPADATGAQDCPCLPSPLVPSPTTLGLATPTGYGQHGCGQHDALTTGVCSTAQPPSWCTTSFCYVNAANCTRASFKSTFYPFSDLVYSYSTCGSRNTFNSNPEAMTASGETPAEKNKVQIATILITAATDVPSRQIFLKLQNEYDGVDLWDSYQVQPVFYLNVQHMIQNNNGLKTFACLHMGDSRGMWLGALPYSEDLPNMSRHTTSPQRITPLLCDGHSYLRCL